MRSTTHIRITKESKKLLKEMAKEENKTMAETLEEILTKEEKELIDKSIQAWKEGKEGAVARVDKLLNI